MQVEEITQILRESPSVRLIKSRSVDFFLSFVIEAFEGQAAIMQERLHMLLENRLDEQENTLVEDDSEMTRLVESNEQKAKRLIKDWTDKGFLTNYQNEEGEVIYEISSHTSKLIDWVVSLKKEDYIGTESKFKTLFSQLKELVEYSNEDREKRLELLRTKKMEIEHQIQRLEMGEEVEVYEDYQIEPRYNSLNKLAKELLSDFKEVDDNFKGIIKEIYERQTENAEKKALLNYIFDAYGELKQSQQGKSFYAFWEFLLSADLQKEWDELTGALYKTLENRGIDAHDMFLKEIKIEKKTDKKIVEYFGNLEKELLEGKLSWLLENLSCPVRFLFPSYEQIRLRMSASKSTVEKLGFENKIMDINGNSKDAGKDFDLRQKYGIWLMNIVRNTVINMILTAVNIKQLTYSKLRKWFLKNTCFGIQLEYTRSGQVVTTTWFSQIDYGVEALIKQYNRFLQGKPTDWRLPVDILSIRFEGILRDMVGDYGGCVTKVGRDNSISQALLDDLLREPCLLQIFRKEDIEFFEYVFTAKGYNIRNYVAHAFYIVDTN